MEVAAGSAVAYGLHFVRDAYRARTVARDICIFSRGVSGARFVSVCVMTFLFNVCHIVGGQHYSRARVANMQLATLAEGARAVDPRHRPRVACADGL